MKRTPSDVVAQVNCCNYLVEAFESKEDKRQQYENRSLQVQLDFAKYPEKYLPIQDPLDAIRIYSRVVDWTIEQSNGTTRVQDLCRKILKIGQTNEGKMYIGLTKEEINDTVPVNEYVVPVSVREAVDYEAVPLRYKFRVIEFCDIMWQAASRLGEKGLAERYCEMRNDVQYGSHWRAFKSNFRQETVGNKIVSERSNRVSCIANDMKALLSDLQNGAMTDGKDRHYSQIVFAKAREKNGLNVVTEFRYDLLKIVDAYEKENDYDKELRWLKQIILLQSEGLWFGDMWNIDIVMSGKTPDGKLTPEFYHGYYYMEPYYERAIGVAQKSHDDESVIELAEDLFYILSQDNRARNQEKTFSDVSDLLYWLRACDLYAYCCCIQNKYMRAGNALLIAEKDLKSSIENWNQEAAKEVEKFGEQRDTKWITEKLNKQREPMFQFFEEQLVLLEKILSEYHPVLSMQRKLMIWFCDDDKRAKKLKKLNKKEKFIAIFNNWDF